MANTVNDVMNVIASPDYGIKSIAGTTHEILAILQGTHNSQNNIHNIVDDVRNLLQTLVETSTQKVKPIEVGDKSTKIRKIYVILNCEITEKNEEKKVQNRIEKNKTLMDFYNQII